MKWLWPGLIVVLLVACERKTESNVTAPGADEAPKTRALDMGAALLQDKAPIDAINTYVDGFHFRNGKMDAQVEAHHYCALLNEEVIQCAIFDGSTRTAKLMGVEYIVSRRLFEALPEHEKAFWHSHVYEVKSGQLTAPGIPEAAERELMEKLVGTYGKTWHTWHTDMKHDLPLGAPQLMMGFTAEGQANQAMVAARDQRLGVSSAELRKRREGILPLPIAAGANAWEKGKVLQVADPSLPESGPQEGETAVARAGR